MRIRSVLSATIACLLLFTSSVDAGQVRIAWDANTEPDVTGYIVEWGPHTAGFTQAVDVGNVTTWTLPSAVEGVVYGFRVIAYDADGLRSDASAPVYATTDGPVGATLAADRSSMSFATVPGTQARTSAQQLRLTARHVVVVVHDEQPEWPLRRGRRTGLAAGNIFLPRARQSHDETATPSRALTRRLDGAAMQLD